MSTHSLISLSLLYLFDAPSRTKATAIHGDCDSILLRDWGVNSSSLRFFHSNMAVVKHGSGDLIHSFSLLLLVSWSRVSASRKSFASKVSFPRALDGSYPKVIMTMRSEFFVGSLEAMRIISIPQRINGSSTQKRR